MSWEGEGSSLPSHGCGLIEMVTKVLPEAQRELGQITLKIGLQHTSVAIKGAGRIDITTSVKEEKYNGILD